MYDMLSVIVRHRRHNTTYETNYYYLYTETMSYVYSDNLPTITRIMDRVICYVIIKIKQTTTTRMTVGVREAVV